MVLWNIFVASYGFMPQKYFFLLTSTNITAEKYSRIYFFCVNTHFSSMDKIFSSTFKYFEDV